ncbi:hypothetical protein CSC70_06325 [Pseudoxanthomonas kalamensis DSM 18571]|uniref:hypothetical protein n=1 Tax=Pseudoxanthomonas kalamensis TaxID=289483 RepID=UPI001391160F|nr:hypothetical protein [Pseudoxanthomonas kalamensis]KAF1710306.1 hypothetical protein CSC70_06325 [Pseudoxanthomonas kalamensis DSM 18571]
MADLPSYVTVLFDGYGEEFDPSIERTEMERGVPKQRVVNSQVMQEITVRLLFKSSADAASFETWYFDTIKRVGWFDMSHPRTGASITARLKEAKIGSLTPLIPDFSWSEREATLEYLR